MPIASSPARAPSEATPGEKATPRSLGSLGALQASSSRASGDEDTQTATQGTPRSSQRPSLANRSSPVKHHPAKHRVRHRKQRAGQTIFKGHPSWKLALNIKLGIAYSVGRSSVAESQRALTLKDFRTTYRQTFPSEGSSHTQAHASDDFVFTDHAPLAFRHLREHFGVKAEDYMVSICGDSSLRELGTPGKSGAVFYLTEDGRYMIKTVSRKESKFLRQILPNYYNYVMRSENTLLPRFFGLIRIVTKAGRRIRLVIFNNLEPELFVHEKYDLKGSTLGRYATDAERSNPNVTLKDLDFNHSLGLARKEYALFRHQIESDCHWLRTLNIMDYSLLVMMHFPDRADALEPADSAPDGIRPAPITPSASNTSSPPADDVRGSGVSHAESDAEGWGDEEDDDGGQALERQIPKLTDADFASAFHKARASSWAIRKGTALDSGFECRTNCDGYGPDGEESAGEACVVFAGLIDVLQIYGARKKIEHQYKSMRYRSEQDGISVTNPHAYADRMTKFLFQHFFDTSRGPRSSSLTPGGGLSPVGEEESGLASGSAGSGRGGSSGKYPSLSDPGTPRSPRSPRGSAAMPETTIAALGAAVTAALTSAPGAETPAIFGPAQKKGSRFPFIWASRYCVVLPSSRALVYYNSEREAKDGSEPRGWKQLLAVSSFDASAQPGSPTHSSKDHPGSSGKGGDGRFSADAAAKSNPDSTILVLILKPGKRMLLRFSTADERERWNLTLSSMLSSSRGSEWTPPVLPPASTKATAAKPAYDSYYDDAYDPSGGTAMAAAV